ncbi:MAG: Na+/H+ antiporter NhaA [Alphaproteobacteria bacterium]|jgi:NhaA family Na+:H+ antiporter|nr:Na+/H+ antiporter NhaA [Rhodospirillaceae bacterium]MBT6512914.1 Na+/H+ antiporter NhaA [Rhodospirillaceae bacterium]MBT7615195.1 Na+/H+ antiporter NhaA [Rhodospirillaceae bacterium]MDG2481670.1 Na+/H+ antiporter NhaA [Alphaproteobacteria bacterium]
MLREFLRLESAAGIILMGAALLALVIDNSPMAWAYDLLLDTPVVVSIGEFSIAKPLLLWVNDGLMAVFFFLIGLELKREMLIGALSTRDRALLPLIAAVGGMVLPALIYVAINGGDPEALRGWAVPTATDIAFALGILAILGSRVPFALKVFLSALAIVDDLGAIVVIAVFYTADLGTWSLIMAAISICALAVLNLMGVTRIVPYLLVGLVLWTFVLKSGVHATLAGVVLAFFIPLEDPRNPDYSPLQDLEHKLHPWVAFMILPIFGFVNAGVDLSGITGDVLWSGIPLGVMLGLFIGKQIGVFGFSWVAVKLDWVTLSDDVSLAMIYGVSLLTGVGFTMSLFIGGLAFADPDQIAMVKIGVLAGSLLSGVAGYLVLRMALNRRPLPA